MSHQIGIMQGRLVPRYAGRYQSFPVGYWQAEFPIARELGIDSIEFIFDYNDADKNPLMSDDGNREIQRAIDGSGVTVRSICADYFMEAPFHRAEHLKASQRVLMHLIRRAPAVGATRIVIPCVDQSSLKTEADHDALVAALKPLLADVENAGCLLNLETDLGPDAFRSLLDRFEKDSPIRVNYDIGNSASLGYDPAEELNAYGEWIDILHVKDRVKGGSSVMLGTGNADFETVFSKLKAFEFDGVITMQASRAVPYLEDLARVSEQLKMTRHWVRTYFGD